MNFDRVAKHFRRLEKIVFRQQMQRCRTAFVRGLPGLKKIALIGEGNGDFLLELMQHAEFEQIHYIDSSRTMLELAQARVRQFSNASAMQIQFYQCDVLQEKLPDQDYDLVVTNFFLDLFDQETLENCIRNIAVACRADALWMYADFQVAGNLLQKSRARSWLKIMYVFFRLVAQIPARELIDPAELLAREGFELKALAEFDRGFMRAELRHKTRAFDTNSEPIQRVSSETKNRSCRPAGK